MRYASPVAFRTGLEARLLNQARESGVDLGRLRRRVVFERLLARLARSHSAGWVLKGGMALEARLGDRARSTRDLDLALRSVAPDGKAGFDEAAGTDRLRLPAVLEFAGIEAVEVDAVDRREHFAEKLHALTRPHDRPNTRVKDLADLVLLIDEGLAADTDLLGVVERVFAGARTHDVPAEIKDPPEFWRERYSQLATDLELSASTLDDSMSCLREFWSHVLATSAAGEER